jgi:hypothetical protein
VGRRSNVGTLLAALAVMAATALGSAPPVPAATTWLCRPPAHPGPCRDTLKTTIQSAGGTSTVSNPKLARKPAIDCFYVYPTVSPQETVNANREKDAELTAIAHQQASRFSQRCRVFAPVYRQLTLKGIFDATDEQVAEGSKIAYRDVLAAWREYLEKDNKGRGVVLIGHSQGTFVLRRLIADVVDDKPAVRRRIVSAILLGGDVEVRRNKGVGGDFEHLPACRSAGQTACVIAYSLFDDAPPEGSRFARAAGDDNEVLCTNPASLADNERRPLTTFARTEPFPGLLGAGLRVLYGGDPPTAPTAWVRPAERYSGRCRSVGGATFLDVEPIGNARKLNASPDAGWGLHLADVNLPLGQLVDVVRTQAKAYAKQAAGR